MADADLPRNWTGFVMSIGSAAAMQVTVIFDKRGSFEVSGHFESTLDKLNGKFSGTLVGPWLTLKSDQGDHFHGQVHESVIIGSVNTEQDRHPIAGVTLIAQQAQLPTHPLGMYSPSNGTT